MRVMPELGYHLYTVDKIVDYIPSITGGHFCSERKQTRWLFHTPVERSIG